MKSELNFESVDCTPQVVKEGAIAAPKTSSASENSLFQPLLLQEQKCFGESCKTGLLTAGLAAAMLFGGAFPAFAADVEFTFEMPATGTAPFDANDSPGNDSSQTNNIVRTLDLITYRWKYTVNNGSSDNSIFTTTLSPNQAFEQIPAACQPGSVSTDPVTNQQTLTCNIGNIPSGTTGFLDFQVKVLTQELDGSTFVGNGDTTTATATFDSDTADPATGGPLNAVVSAAPKVDLLKNAAWVSGTRIDPATGENGAVVRYPISMIISGGGKGSEPLQSPMSFVDDLSQHVPGTKLYNWGPHSGCGPLGKPMFYGSRPYGVNDGTYPADRSVEDSGTWSCTQGAPGGNISVSITGADTTGVHAPTKSYNNVTLPASQTWLVSGFMELWMPTQAILDAGGSITVTNTVTDLQATGVSGNPNQDPNLANNSYQHTVIAGRGSFNQYYALRYQNRGTRMPGMSNLNGGDGPVMATQNFTKRLYGLNRGLLGWEDYMYCEKFDNETHKLVDIPGQPAGEAVKVYNGGPAYNYVIEYGTGGYANYTDQRTTTCEDAESPDGWFTNLNSVPGGRDAVTKIRFRALEPVPPNASMDLAVNFEARNNFLTSGTPIPVGTILANHSAIRTPTLYANTNSFPGNWNRGNYNPTTHGGSKALGDRLTFVRGIVRIDKTTVPNDQVNTVLAGGTVTYQLQPTVTAPINPAPVNPVVTVTDILPAGMTYVVGSASLPPTSITPNTDGTTTIVWNLGPQVPGQPVTPITFDAQVSPIVANNTDLVNETIVSSPEDPSPESARDDDRTVTVGNPGAYGLSKDTSTPLIPLNNQMTFRLFMANLSAVDLEAAEFIDVLPYNGDGNHPPDGRIPPSNFSGTATFNSISGSNGETFTFTNAPQNTIAPDPANNTNTWCPQTAFGTPGCPANNADVTAVRISAPAFPAGTPTRQVDLVLDTSGNEPGEVYTNDATGRPNNLGFIISPDAIVRTLPRQVDIELDKSVSDVDGIVEVGDTITYTLDVVNKGPDDARFVEITDALPAGLSYVSDDSGGSYNSTTGVWTVGPMAANATAQLNITVQVTGVGSITNTAEVTADDDNADPSLTNDVDSTPGNGNADEDDQDSITITSIKPEIGVAKNAASVSGRDVTFDFVIENLGGTNLNNVSLTDNLDATFGAGNYTVAAPTIQVAPSAGSTVTANPGFNGSSDINLIAPNNSALVPGETVTVRVVVTVNTFIDPDGPGPLGFAEYENQATTSGTSPGGTTVTDQSDDGTDPDPDGDGNPGGEDETDSPEDDPTPVDFMIMPEIGAAKTVVSNVNNGNGTYTVTYDIVVENLGNIALQNVQLAENFATTFAGATGFSVSNVTVASGTVTANPSFDGSGDTNLLGGTDSLAVGATATLRLEVLVTPGSNNGPYNNQVVATGTGDSIPVTDDSDDGTDPDPDGDGNPGGPDETDSPEDDPTPVSFTENPEIGTAKRAVQTTNNQDGTYEVTYRIVVENLGDVNLSNVQLTEDLATTFAGATGFTVDSLTFVSGAAVTPNGSFNGSSDQNLLAGTDALAIGASAELELVITLTPGVASATYNNTVVADGTSPGGTGVTDDSDDGTDPDPDVDGNPGGPDETDSSEDDPTPVSIDESPEIGVAKDVSNVKNNGDGSYEITYAIALENLGNVNLSNVQLTEDFNATFGAATSFAFNSLSVTSGPVTANTAFNGTTDTNLLIGTETLNVNGTATLELVVTVVPANITDTYLNTVVADGTSPGGDPVTDDSDDGTDPDPDGDGNPGGPDETDSPEDDPTPVDFSENPEIGTAKRAVQTTNNQDGTYEVTYRIVVENLGDVNLNNVQLTEDLATTFAGATGFTVDSLTLVSGAVTPNAAFNGSSNQNLLAGTDSLALGATAELELVVTLTPGVASATYNNTVVASGTGPGGTGVTDDSDDGTDPDPDGDGNPGGPDETDSSEDDPTPVSIDESPEIGVAKDVSNVKNNGDGSYEITYAIALENLGNVNLSNVQLTEDFNATFGAATSFAFNSLSVTSGSVTANTAFNGTTDTNLLIGTETLNVNGTATLELVVTVVPANITDTYLNTVVADGTSPGGDPVTDDSDDGTDPDPDGDGNPGGPDETDSPEDDPTPVDFSEDPEIGTAKRVVQTTNNQDGTYQVTYRIVVENLGDVNLSSVQLTEDLATTFAGATAFSVNSLTLVSGAVTPNGGFNGGSDQNLLAGSDTLAVGASAELELVVDLTPGVASATYNNTVVADGTSPGGTGVTDDSDDGTDPDPDGDGNPGGPDETDSPEDDPTPVSIDETPEIGVAKNVSNVKNNGDGSYEITYAIAVENLGNVNLSNVQLTEDLNATFGAATSFAFNSLSVTGGPVTANTAFNGTTDTNLLIGTETLNVNGTATLELVVTVVPANITDTYLNTVVGNGTSPGGDPVTDDSDDGTDPDPDGDGNPGGPDETDSSEDDPTPVSFSEDPEIGTAKRVVQTVNNQDGTYTITYGVVVENLGDVNLNNVQLTEDLGATFAGATGFVVDSVTVVNGGVTANTNFDGTNDQNLLVGSDALAIGNTAEIEFVVTVTPGVASATYNNTVVADGTSPGGTGVTDDSDDGTDPDPDGDGNPGGPDETDSPEDDPTPVSIDESPEIGVAKEVSEVKNNGDGSYEIKYAIALENLGNVNLSNVQLTEDFNATFGAATSFSFNSLSVTSGPVTANAAFDGTTDTNLLIGTETLTVNGTATLELVVTVVPANITDTYLNTVVADGTSPGGDPVTDNSDDGTDPDPDGDGNPGGPDETDSSEDDPTPVDFSENPEIGTAKRVVQTTNNQDGTYTVTYSVIVENLGDVNLSNVQLTEDLGATFVSATGFTVDGLTVVNGGVTANTNFDGTSDQNLLVGSDALAIGNTAELELVVTVTPGVASATYNNTVVADGTSPGGTGVTDDSDDGTDPDPDGDGNPGGPDETDSPEDDPTPVSFTEEPEIGAAKQVTSTVNNQDGTYQITYSIVVENLGDVNLNNVQLTEDLSTTFAGATGFTVDSLSVTSGGVTPNASFDGSANSTLLSGSDTLPVGGSAELELVVTLTPGVGSATYNNTVVADGTSPGGDPVTDDSDDGTDPDPDGDGNPGGPDETDSPEDDPTPVSLSESPEMGVAKQVTNQVNNGDGTYEVTYRIVVENLGDVNLNNVQLTEDLSTTFAGATGFTVDALSVVSGSVTANGAFNGGGDTNLLGGSDSLAVGTTAELELVVTLTPGVSSATYNNTVVGNSTSPGGDPVTDESDDGTDPDPDGDGNPGGPDETDSSEDDPTPVNLSESPEIGTAKQVVSSQNNGDGTYTVTYDIVVENLGDVNLNNVQLTENLATTFATATGFTVDSLTVTAGTVTANPSFDGNGDASLLAAGTSLAQAETATLQLVITVTPGADLGPYSNTVVADGTSPGGDPVSDNSDDGTDPDPDGDGNPGGPDETDSPEDDPTPVSFTENPVIGTAKQVAGIQNNGDGSYSVTYDIVVENLGDVSLANVQLTEDLSATFAGATSFTLDSLTVTSGAVTTNPAYDGSSDAGLLAGSDNLAAAEIATLQLVVTVVPASLTDTYSNTVVASGDSPSGAPVSDNSDDGTDPDPDDDGLPSGPDDNDPSGTEDDPTPVMFAEMPEMGVAKQVNTVTNNGDGSYDVTYDIVVENLGDVDVTNLQLTEDLSATFAGTASFSVGSVTVSSGSVTVSPSFDGSTDTAMLAGSDVLAVGETVQLQLLVVVTPGSNLGPYNNQILGEGSSPGGTPVTDLSDNGADPDTDGDGNPGGADETDAEEDDPTPIEFTENPVIGVAKAISGSISNGDGTYSVTYDIKAQNLGDVDLSDVQLVEDLSATFAGAQGFSVQSLTQVSGPVTVNTSFNGAADVNLLMGIDTLKVGEEAELELVVLVTPGSNLGPYDNSVNASGTSPSSTTVDDISDDGTESDSDGNGVPDDEGNNDPTTIVFESNPRVRLLKRITSVITRDGSRDFTDVVDDSEESAALIQAGLNPVGTPEITTDAPVFSGDIVEYTIYFVSDGNVAAAPVNLCDLVPTDTMFMTDSFGASQGISVLLPGAATPALQSNAVDGDAGAYYSPLSPLPAGTVCSDPSNPNGAVLVDLQTVPNTPGGNAGFIRFRVRVN